MGRSAEGIVEAKRAIELDPLSPIVHVGAAEEYIFAGKPDEAIQELQRAIELEPHFASAHSTLGDAYLEKKMYPEAIAEFQLALSISESTNTRSELGYAYGLSGRTQQAREILQTFLRLEAERKEDFGFEIGVVYIGLGEMDKALESLEKSIHVHSANFAHLKSDPIFKSLQTERRFRAILKKVGLDA